MSEPNPWVPHGPFCWQPKVALRKIRESLDGENTVATGIDVYVAITEIASDKRSSEFQSTYGFLSMRTGLSPRTIQARVKDLVSLGLLKFSVPKVKAPGTFKLVQQPLPDDKQPLLSVAQPLPNDRQRLDQASLPRSEEYKEESLEKDCGESGVEPLPSFPKSEADAIARLPIFLQEQRDWVIKTFHKAIGRGGRDARDVPIRKWESYAQTEWKYEQERRARTRPLSSATPGKPAELPKHVTGEVLL